MAEIVSTIGLSNKEFIGVMRATYASELHNSFGVDKLREALTRLEEKEAEFIRMENAWRREVARIQRNK